MALVAFGVSIPLAGTHETDPCWLLPLKQLDLVALLINIIKEIPYAFPELIESDPALV